MNLKLLAIPVLIALATGVHAGPTSGDFREELSLPIIVPASGPRVFERLAEPVSGAPDLTEADQVANPGNFSGHADVDLDSTGLITLTGREPFGFADYQLAIIRISNIAFDLGESITGVNVLDGTGIFDGQFDSTFPAPSIDFTANSVQIRYEALEGNEFNFGEGRTARFQLLFGNTDVPAPGALALLGLGLAGFAAARRRAG